MHIVKWFSQFGVDERDWHAQNHELNHIQHVSDEVEHQLSDLDTKHHCWT